MCFDKVSAVVLQLGCTVARRFAALRSTDGASRTAAITAHQGTTARLQSELRELPRTLSQTPPRRESQVIGMVAASLPSGLIINADDLAIHPRINAGIRSAYRHGILTSCTMLVTTPYFEQTVRDFVRPNGIPTGIHLSLTLGKAVAPAHEVPDLVNQAGDLKLSAQRLIFALLASDRSRTLLAQIERELAAQLARARDVGLRPTHADSHQHLHMIPAIFAVLEKLLPHFSIDRVRYCRESFFVFGSDLPGIVRRRNPAKWALLRWCSRRIRSRLMMTDEFFGVLYSGVINKRVLEKLITALPNDHSLEICVHPGFPAPAGEAFYPPPDNAFISSEARQAEHDMLIDPSLEELIRERGLVLRAFDGEPKLLRTQCRS